MDPYIQSTLFQLNEQSKERDILFLGFHCVISILIMTHRISVFIEVATFKRYGLYAVNLFHLSDVMVSLVSPPNAEIMPSVSSKGAIFLFFLPLTE